MKTFLLMLMAFFFCIISVCQNENSLTNVELPKFSEIQGQVIFSFDNQSIFIEGAIITIGEFADTTDSEGLFNFDSILNGEVSYSCTHPNYDSSGGTLIVEDSVQTFDIYLERQPNIIMGQVTGWRGEIVEGALISIGDVSETTDASGNYFLSVNELGVFEFSCHHDDYENYSGLLKVQFDTVVINIGLLPSSGIYADTLWVEEDATIRSRIHVIRGYHGFPHIVEELWTDSNYADVSEIEVQGDVYTIESNPDSSDYWLNMKRILIKPPEIPRYLLSRTDSMVLHLTRKHGLWQSEFRLRYATSEWAESTVTWRNQPTLSDTIAQFPIPIEDSVFILNLTEYYNDTTNSNYGIFINSYIDEKWSQFWSAFNNRIFHSSEASNLNDRPFVIFYSTIE